jgi:hypothetical protein
MSARPLPRPIAAILMSLPLVALIASSLPGPAAGGEGKRSAGSTTTWSSSASGKTVKSETRRAPPGGYSYSNTFSDSRDGAAEVDAWMFSRGEGHWRNSSGSQRDWREAEAAVERADGDVFWFRRDDDRYLVTDAAALRELADLFAPQEELGRRQGELGRKQGELGRQQGDLGRKQGQLGRIQARLAQHQVVAAFGRASRDRRANDELERQREEIERQQSEAGELQAELGEQQSALGERQAALGEQQAALGREQERVSKEVGVALGRLTREMIAEGRAKRIER